MINYKQGYIKLVAFLKDTPSAPVSSELRVVFPAFSLFLTGGLITYKFSCIGICSDCHLTLPSPNISTCLSFKTHKVLPMNSTRCFQVFVWKCASCSVCLRRPAAETHGVAATYIGVAMVINSVRLGKRLKKGREEKGTKTKNLTLTFC